MKWVVAFAGLALGACTFKDGQAPVKTDDAASIDTLDGPDIDAPKPTFCFGRDAEDKVCLAEMPTGSVSLSNVLNTDSSPLCAKDVASGPAGCVIAGDSIGTGNIVAVTGNRPLILIATDTITISHLLDVSSHRGGLGGPGNGATGCDMASATVGLGGGAGGSFGGKGGDGGDQTATNVGANAGMPLTPTMIRGGCPGSTAGSGGPGGRGGGGVLLIAPNVVITSQINASGESGGNSLAGGGGGGSGGMIAIDADTVSGGGAILANGGGGAGGSNIGPTGNGHEPDPSFPTMLAAGGSGTNNADGGAGGAGMTHDGAPGDGPSNGMSGAGGGGGGVGILRFYGATLTDGTISPF